MQCSICKKEMVLAKGVTLFKRDGTSMRFCAKKCERTHEMKRRSPLWITKPIRLKARKK